ncbi:hypothetical protein [Eudoraea chungangensis]|uniref:hypothetical protein n=1 Tax=Eudoraea chungangensis TaxID=1481905 RepID=UPI0023EDA293|nr:hypothetical protein [Eudoraea chungangensis]
MRTIINYLVVFSLCIFTTTLMAQETADQQIQELKLERERVTLQEKKALKSEVEAINSRLEKGTLTKEEADELKEEAAKKRALNIEDRLSIIDNKIAILERNGLENPSELAIEEDKEEKEEKTTVIKIDRDDWDLFYNENGWSKYDRRTYSDFVIAFGLNNAIIDGESLEDTPYKVWGSRFFEIGWNWRTRVFNNSNFLRFHYGFSFQFNGLKSKNNFYYTTNELGETVYEQFPYDLSKSKLRMDNLVVPVYFEFGPSKTKVSQNSIRYSLNNQFRIGLGGYGGFNLGTRQKLKYNRDGQNVKEKLKGGINSSQFIYGLSGYMGVDCFLVYVKYDLNPIFRDYTPEQRNISFGLRFTL